MIFKHESDGKFNFPRSRICFNLVEVVILESFHTSLPFKANETNIPEQKKQRSIKEHYTLSLFSYYFWCFQITDSVFGFLLLLSWGAGFVYLFSCSECLRNRIDPWTHRAHLAEGVWPQLWALSSESSKVEDVMCLLPPLGA